MQDDRDFIILKLKLRVGAVIQEIIDENGGSFDDFREHLAAEMLTLAAWAADDTGRCSEQIFLKMALTSWQLVRNGEYLQ